MTHTPSGSTVSQIVGSFLAGQRRLRNVRQDAIAAHVGVNPATIRNWEGGKTSPTLDQVAAWVDALGLDADGRAFVAGALMEVASC